VSRIYIVIVEDRHIGVEAFPYTDKERAINIAKQITKDNASGFLDEHCLENSSGDERNNMWLYHAIYSVEGDSVKVISARLNEEMQP